MSSSAGMNCDTKDSLQLKGIGLYVRRRTLKHCTTQTDQRSESQEDTELLKLFTPRHSEPELHLSVSLAKGGRCFLQVDHVGGMQALLCPPIHIPLPLMPHTVCE